MSHYGGFVPSWAQVPVTVKGGCSIHADLSSRVPSGGDSGVASKSSVPTTSLRDKDKFPIPQRKFVATSTHSESFCGAEVRPVERRKGGDTGRPNVRMHRGSAFDRTDRELLESGTVRSAGYIPGYLGFIPRSGSRHVESSEANGLKEMANANFRQNMPGYTGHVARSAFNDQRPRREERGTTAGASFKGGK